MKKDDADQNPSKALFPSPPTRPSDIRFRLKRHLWLKAHWFTATGGDDVTTLGGMESATSASAGSKPVEVEVSGRNWIPSETDKNTGVWLQETSFRCVFVLTCPPSFQAETLHIKVRVCFRSEFVEFTSFIRSVFPRLENRFSGTRKRSSCGSTCSHSLRTVCDSTLLRTWLRSASPTYLGLTAVRHCIFICENMCIQLCAF